VKKWQNGRESLRRLQRTAGFNASKEEKKKKKKIEDRTTCFSDHGTVYNS
jgi:hypothetical protein